MKTEFKGPDGQVYGLVHLKPQNYQIKLKIDNDIYDVPAVVMFSNHCYTDGKNKNGTVAQESDDWYCTTDDKGHRVFCSDRWRASLALPAYLKTMIESELECYRLNKSGHFIRIHDHETSNKFEGWYVFFAFDKAKGTGPGIVRINVTSHHRRNASPDNLKSPVKMKFDSLLAQWFKNRPPLLQKLTEMQIRKKAA